jgi:hypothetical protein
MQRTTRSRLLLFTQTIVIALFGCSQPTPTQTGLTPAPAQTRSQSAGVISTPMEAALDGLFTRFPNQVVMGFEELWEARPDSEPQVDLGPPDATLQGVRERIRELNPTYKVELLEHRLVHVYPAHGTADPAQLLDISLKRFRMPADRCLGEAIDDIAWHHIAVRGSYALELSQFLLKKEREWYRKQGKEPPWRASLEDVRQLHHRITKASPFPPFIATSPCGRP